MDAMMKKSAVKAELGTLDLLRVFWRLLFFQGLFNTRGLQDLSMASALSPVRAKIANGSRNNVALKHLSYFNCNPNVAPLIVGGVLKLETERANGKPVSDTDIEYFKNSLAGPFAAMGDMLLLENVKPVALTCACIFAIYKSIIGLLVVFLLYNLLIISCRLWGVYFGYSKGWELVEYFSGPRYQRVLGFAQGIGAVTGGVLLAILLDGLPQNGRWMLIPAGVLAGVALYLLKKNVPASWFAIILFPAFALFALMLS